MYKITLGDNNCGSCSSGVFRCYTEDIELFQNEWEALQFDDSIVERFRRSKGGEAVADYLNDNPSLNIVQEDRNAIVLYGKDIHIMNKHFVLYNVYDWPSKFYVHKAKINLKYVRYENDLLLLGKYSIHGIAEADPFDVVNYIRVECYGNTILKTETASLKGGSTDVSLFANDTVESIAYLPVKRFVSEEELHRDFSQRECLSEEELSILLTDISGEAG